ncbi:MAG: hypothetical protein HGJ94_18330 [Desulfosarcina sp.]|nr:hypothetical protein [Desulfosarcina sp.]
MALNYESDKVANRHLYQPPAPHSSGEVYCIPFKATVDTSLAINHLVGLCPLPANCIPVDIKMYLDDIDGVTSLEWDVGILNADKDGLVPSSLLIDGATVGRTAGFQDMNDLECVFEPATWLAESTCPAIDAEKTVVMKIIAAAATPVAGDIYGVLYFRSSDHGK